MNTKNIDVENKIQKPACITFRLPADSIINRSVLLFLKTSP